MLINYLKIAYRNLFKKKIFSLINIAGLSVGLACFLLIMLYVADEFSYDRFHQNADRIVRVAMEYSFGGEIGKAEVTGTKVAPAFSRDFPEVERAVRVYRNPTVVKYKENIFEEKSFFYADSSFFNIFSFNLISGDASRVLEEPKQIVITESTAKRYFGNENPLGKILKINNEKDYQVTGIAEDVPHNSQIKFDFLASFSSLNVAKKEEWFSANYITYFLLTSQSAIETLQAKIPQYMQEQLKETFSENGGYLTYNLEPLKNIHLCLL
ncbi:hypothetical protein BH23BAC1_BH23BAC1_47500 [soil metagenome]